MKTNIGLKEHTYGMLMECLLPDGINTFFSYWQMLFIVTWLILSNPENFPRE